MATVNLGNVVGLLKQLTPPASKPYVLWGKILNPSFPDIVELRQYKGTGDPALEANWQAVTGGYWVENPVASGNIEYLAGGLSNQRSSTPNVEDMDTKILNHPDPLDLGIEGAALVAEQTDEGTGDDIVAQNAVGYLGGLLFAGSFNHNTTTDAATYVAAINGNAFMQIVDTFTGPTKSSYVFVNKDGVDITFDDINGTNPYPYKVRGFGTSGYAFQASKNHDVILGNSGAGTKLGFFGNQGSAQGSVGALTVTSAGVMYTANEQNMLNDIHGKLTTLLSIVNSYNFIKVI